MAAYSPAQLAQLRESTERLAALTASLKRAPPHAMGGVPVRAPAGLNAALLSVEAEQNLRHTERILATLQPALEQTERRLVSKIQQVGDKKLEREPGAPAHGVTATFEGGARAPLTALAHGDHIQHDAHTISGRPDDQVGDATVDPTTRADPADGVRRRHRDGLRQREGHQGGLLVRQAGPGARTRHAPPRALLSRASLRGDLVVSVTVRRKDDRPKRSWALVSFATEASAKKLLEEQNRDIEHRLTGKTWKFLAYELHKLKSHEALSRRYSLVRRMLPSGADWNHRARHLAAEGGALPDTLRSNDLGRFDSRPLVPRGF